ncbi:hypothetical protein COCMIDRAFT_31371 [Bipolaris oryzae ATCC 44560]|uniref:Uncharacterized protein n=1 Tax=Bipolaris oryzae ATCC 44560 TaxID=930090 RepID=W6ZMB5_COCMI|nr:uncharacterized protein COCMIDRAFT_31371 [Bipolaris oryzae ATCC 44560]EUC51225.1 hypothetical protein COCMIDRAFT_31371 [Bipolaris oryzae ATCC 44560]
MDVWMYVCHVYHTPAASPPTITAPLPAAADDDAPCDACRERAVLPPDILRTAYKQSRLPQPKPDKTGASDVRLSGSLQLHPRKSRRSGFCCQPTCHGACTPRPQRCRPGLRSYTLHSYLVCLCVCLCVCVYYTHSLSNKACCLLSVSHIQRMLLTHA